jgi:hypothetical protein
MTSFETLNISLALDIKLFEESVSRDIGTEGYLGKADDERAHLSPPCELPWNQKSEKNGEMGLSLGKV